MRSRTWTIYVLLASGVAVAACGGGGTQSSGGSGGAGDGGAGTTTSTSTSVSTTSTSTSVSTTSTGTGGSTTTGAGAGSSSSTTTTTSTGMGVCGDDVVDMGEQCDGANLNGMTCLLLGYTGGALSCSGTCAFDTSGCTSTPTCAHDKCTAGTQLNAMCDPCVGQVCAQDAYCCTTAWDSKCVGETNEICGVGTCVVPCGNGMIDMGESCDGTDLDGATCQSQGYAGGTLSCSTTCAFDTSKCTNCGNGAVDMGEFCDGTDLGGATCQSQGYMGGTLSCSGICTFDTSQCTGGATCAHDKCTEGVKLDMSCDPCVGQVCAQDAYCCSGAWDSKCVGETNEICGVGTCAVPCGNGMIDMGESCDGTNLDGATCQSQGYLGGTLSCSTGCKFDTSQCTNCGNGMVDMGESCDGTNLDGATCQSQGYPGGTLSCSTSCTFDTSQCTGTPGCVHDKCTTGTPLNSACDPCVGQVCAQDPYCCTDAWDSVCVDKTNAICGMGTCP